MTDIRCFDTMMHNRIAFRHLPRSQVGTSPAVVFLPGYMSDMAGSKATAVYEWCRDEGRECLLLDYAGCGQSHGEFADQTLSEWTNDTLDLIEHVVAGPVVLVGSSMGGWLMLGAGQVLQEADRLAGLVGIAAAPDFSDWGYSDEQKTLLRAGKTVFEANPYGPEPTPTHGRFWQDAQRQRVLGNRITLDCPVRLLHGELDADVPSAIAFRLATALRSQDVQVTIVKGGDHRLSRDGDIALLLHTLAWFK
ncbi:alpha/beta hydrolase [Alteraurantiacibacter buctensis]|uniref:Palmitoyl-protein thioesterase ABHD10, mitochondrial n=1 Tax=Alteraurantiacibacter buctensis TaxID=1503981 RepID=A0A844YTP3_9SPHN|nr:alpha/beta hydrolase [Alteraurantiacibacter buctensis]MXO70386.1 alpha/beta fold hydrolase [Alteraurantiacibacter buctensis]